MNLASGRTLLSINSVALIVASLATAETAYIRIRLMGRFGPDDALLCLLPFLMMLIIRNRRFSQAFLFLYVALSIQQWFEARSVYFGTFKWAGAHDPSGYALLFALMSLACLMIYIALILVRILIRLFVLVTAPDEFDALHDDVLNGHDTSIVRRDAP